MDQMCCTDCFSHKWLREYVHDNSDEKRDCNYCGREGVDLIPVGALYEPFKNRECLHCHATARSYEETSPHREMKDQLASNDMSCLTCHTKVHDVANIDKKKTWKGPGG